MLSEGTDFSFDTGSDKFCIRLLFSGTQKSKDTYDAAYTNQKTHNEENMIFGM